MFERPYDPYVGGSGYRKKMARNGLSGMQKEKTFSAFSFLALYLCVDIPVLPTAKQEKSNININLPKKPQTLFILIADTSGSHLLTSSGDDEMLSLCAGRNFIIYLDWRFSSLEFRLTWGRVYAFSVHVSPEHEHAWCNGSSNYIC